jgi:ketosteroid isomerase-like protein
MQKPSRIVRLASMFALLAVILPAAVRAQESSDTTKLAGPLRNARGAFNKALTSGDGAGAASSFSDSVTVDFQGQVYSGKDAATGWMVEALQGISALKFSPPSFKISDSEVTETASYTVATPGGDQSGTTETVWKKQKDGAWKILRLRVS